ncbi:hypothetical protein ES703_77256 [subsurface metagenome]
MVSLDSRPRRTQADMHPPGMELVGDCLEGSQVIRSS